MKICVYGAGAVGGHLAGRLAQGGAEVSLVARGAHLDALQRNGLRVLTGGGEITAKLAASDDPRVLGRQDAVIVTVKAPSLPEVAAGIGPLLGPDTPVAFVMNGIPWWYFDGHGGPYEGRHLPLLDPQDVLRCAVGPERVIGGVVYSAVTVTEPGTIRHNAGGNRLILGEIDGRDSARMAALAAPIRQGGMDVQISRRIRDDMWTKLIVNLSSNPIALLTQSTLREVYAEPACIEAARRIMVEVAAIAAALGCEPDPTISRTLSAGPGMAFKPSMVQDLERGRPMEIDALIEQPLELARLTGVATPTLDLVAALARIRARTAKAASAPPERNA